MDSKGNEEKKVKLEIYAKHLVKKLAQSVSDKDKVFTGIPLQCRMLAEAFDREVETFCKSAESVPELPLSLNLLGLFERFLNRKYDICCEEKFKIPTKNVGAKGVVEHFVKNIRVEHQIVALKVLFGEEQVALLQINSQCTSSEEDLIRTGIVQASHDGKLHFIHRTFAEYYVAEFFNKLLKNMSNPSQKMQDFLLQKIFLEADYRVVRIFMDTFLSQSKPTKNVLKQYGNRIRDLYREPVRILQLAALEGNAYIVQFLLDSVQVARLDQDIIHELLLATGNGKQTAWQQAVYCGNLQIIEMLWEFGKKKLTKRVLSDKLLLAKDNMRETAWQYTSWQGNIDLLQKLWN
jgi:hypothetical protein